MAGNRNESDSNPESLKPEAAELEPDPLKSSLIESSIISSDMKDRNDDISNEAEVSAMEEQKQMSHVSSEFVVSDGHEEMDQSALEDNGHEKNAMTEIKAHTIDDACTQVGSIDDVKEVIDGGRETNKFGVDDKNHEKNAMTEIKANTTDDACTQEGSIDDLKEVINGGRETNKLSVEDDEESTDTEEAPWNVDNNDLSIGYETEVMTEDMYNIYEVLPSDHVLTVNTNESVECKKEPSEVDAEDPVGTTSDREEKENANFANEVKDVTDNNTIENKVVKEKLVRKRLVRKNAVNEEVEQPADKNNVSGEACVIDTDKHKNIEEKASGLNNGSVGECKADNNERVSSEAQVEVKPSVTINWRRMKIWKKKPPQGHSGTATVEDAQKPQTENDKLGSEEHIAINESNSNEDVDNSGNKGSSLKRSKKKERVERGSRREVSKHIKKLKEDSSSKRVDIMGMIFMCNSETKNDCYRYNILGLPGSKKEMVSKIYKGMKLFLFDVDLRMMYGIYKAAGPGGYNFERRAFKSQFPSQVRFSVAEDCVPLAEERFRKVLKDNYYSRNKFNLQLNNEQVKNLCKLFHEASKKAGSKKVAVDTRRAAPISSAARQDNRKRKRAEDNHRVVAARTRSLEREQTSSMGYEETRVAPVVLTNRYLELPTYERETYVSAVQPVPIYQPPPPPLSPPSRTYTFDSLLNTDPSRKYLASSSLDSRLLEFSHKDPYVSYREFPQVYSGQTYCSGTRKELYDHNTSDGSYADVVEYYRSADYRPPPPLYRRY